MKKLMLFFTATCSLFACKEAPNTDDASAQQAVADSTEIAHVIHGFYQWYDPFLRNEATDVNFTVVEGDHFKLNQPALERYFSFFKKTGFVSDEFIAGEMAYYKKCEELWKTEPMDEPLSGMDADKYFCGQDWELDFFTKSPVRIQATGTGKATATLHGTMGGSPLERNFELKKENGKWVLTKIECDMGLDALAEQKTVEALAAFYSGTLPCKDCKGINTVLTLNADPQRSYSLMEEFKGKKGDPVETTGTWTVADGIVILDGKTKYQVTPTGMVKMNDDGSLMDAKKYELKKVQGE